MRGYIILIAMFLAVVSSVKPQTYNNFTEDETIFYAMNKQVGQFVHRFNMEEDQFGKNLSKNDSMFHNNKLREKILPGMFDKLNINQEDLDFTYKSFRDYRDKYIAHLDSDEVFQIPEVSKGLNMVFFYYNEVKALCESVADWPNSIEEFYNEHYQKALRQYEKLKT